MEDFCKSIKEFQKISIDECKANYQEMATHCVTMLNDLGKPLIKEFFTVKFYTGGLWRGIFNTLTRLRFATRSLGPYNLKGVKIRYGPRECNQLIRNSMKAYTTLISENDAKAFIGRLEVEVLLAFILLIVTAVVIFKILSKSCSKQVTKVKKDPFEENMKYYDDHLIKTMFERNTHKNMGSRVLRLLRTEATNLHHVGATLDPDAPTVFFKGSTKTFVDSERITGRLTIKPYGPEVPNTAHISKFNICCNFDTSGAISVLTPTTGVFEYSSVSDCLENNMETSISEPESPRVEKKSPVIIEKPVRLESQEKVSKKVTFRKPLVSQRNVPKSTFSLKSKPIATTQQKFKNF